ncbi:MAG: prolyl oligopeptidase family serine peptidase, partial [Pseudomonadota bacterium]
DINGISDISTMLQEVPVYWRGWPHWYQKYIGDPDDPDQLAEIRDRSPLYHADKVTAPLLIIQGSNDVRVIQDQADRMVDALREHGKDVDYMLLEGAGHQFRNWGWKTRLIAYRKIERFLAEHLGGRADGFDYAVLGAHVLP